MNNLLSKISKIDEQDFPLDLKKSRRKIFYSLVCSIIFYNYFT